MKKQIHIKSIQYLLIISFIIAESSILASIKDPSKLFAQIAKKVDRGSLSRKDEEYYAQQLRLLLLNETGDIGSGKLNPMSVMNALLKIREYIRLEFPFVTNEEYKTAEYSVGVAFLDKKINDLDKTIDVLIREANCLSASAQIQLKIMYGYSVKGTPEYTKKILNFFKTTAQEGLPRSQFDYGQILLKGHGVQKDIRNGLKYLEASGIDEAQLELANYYFKQNDEINFEKYIRLAADQGNFNGIYNLAILEQGRKHYKKAIDLFKKIPQSQQTDYWNAKLELGRMHIEGWGFAKNEKKGFKLIQEVSKKAEAEETRAIAYLNLGIFYQKGIAVQKSISEAKECFKKAQKLGYEEAKTYLERLA